MSKINKNNLNINMQKLVMDKIKSGQVTMKPRWYFVAGSILSVAGLIGVSISSIFLINLTLFLIRKRGPGIGRLNLMLNSFPIWVPIVAVFGIIAGVLLLKKYDFSYRKNFWYVVAGFVASIIFAAMAIDYLGLNEIWYKKGPMQRFYRHIENGNGEVLNNVLRNGIRDRNYYIREK